MIDDPYIKSTQALIESERKRGCLCYHEPPRGKIDKAYGQEFKPVEGCPVHGWMLEDRKLS